MTFEIFFNFYFFKGVINLEFLNSLIFGNYKSDFHTTKSLNLLQETNSRYFTFVLSGLRLEKEVNINQVTNGGFVL